MLVEFRIIPTANFRFIQRARACHKYGLMRNNFEFTMNNDVVLTNGTITRLI